MSCVRRSTQPLGILLLSIKYFLDISKKFHPISDETAHMKILLNLIHVNYNKQTKTKQINLARKRKKME